MSINIDMAEIIEFVMPVKSEYREQTNDGGGGGGGEDDESDSNNQYVVLDAVDVGREYKSEEFLLVTDEQFQQQLELLDQSTLHLPKDEEEGQEEEDEEEVQYMVEEPQPVDLDDLVEEAIEDEEDQEQEEHYEQEEEDENDGYVVEPNPDQLYAWTYVQSPSPVEAEYVTPELGLPKQFPKTKSLKRNYVFNESQTYANIDQQTTTVTMLKVPIDESVQQLTKPSEKMMDEFKGPRRYMLFDELIATIVDFDEDKTPIVEFSMIGSHQDEKLPVECGICPDVMHKSKLSKHQKTHLVRGTNRYACIYCTETYRDCKYLAGHARRHMGIRPYVCEPCKLYFSTKQDLRVHNQRRHLEKEHICEMCGKTFAQNTQLKRHREATHEKKRRFQCAFCQKAYYKNFSLKEHIRNVHMGKRRMLKCPFCGMQCRDAHKMARHRKEMHLNQDTYMCHLCQEEFTDINYFDAHKRSIQCRSNTRRLRLMNKEANEGQGSLDEDGIFIGEGEELGDMLEEEFDEDAGLLIESNYVNGVEEEQLQQQQQEQQQQPLEEETATIYETVNGNYLHEQETDQQQDTDQDLDLDQDQEQQYLQQHQQQQQYEQINYEDEDDGLLVEHVKEEDELIDKDDDEDVDNDYDDDDAEQYLETQMDQSVIGYQQQHTHHNRQQEYNDDELVYEITLETEDN